MKFMRWFKMKLIRKTTPNHKNGGGKSFEKMLEVEKEEAVRAHKEAQDQVERAKALRSRSWYLHGQFEKAKTTDPFSEWLFGNDPRGRTP